MALKIRAALKKLGISESELARRLGMSRGNLNRRLQRDNFKTSDLEQIAEALGCSFEQHFIFPDEVI